MLLTSLLSLLPDLPSQSQGNVILFLESFKHYVICMCINIMYYILCIVHYTLCIIHYIYVYMYITTLGKLKKDSVILGKIS